MEDQTHGSSAFVTWLVIIGLFVLIFMKGAFAFFMIGDRGQPGWDYRPVPDTPGESPYAIYETLPHPQHVKGAKGH
jgi:hypothetical protein